MLLHLWPLGTCAGLASVSCVLLRELGEDADVGVLAGISFDLPLYLSQRLDQL
jgi:hypothetical protein